MLNRQLSRAYVNAQVSQSAEEEKSTRTLINDVDKGKDYRGVMQSHIHVDTEKWLRISLNSRRPCIILPRPFVLIQGEVRAEDANLLNFNFSIGKVSDHAQ